jgi:hypothetical protein
VGFFISKCFHIFATKKPMINKIVTFGCSQYVHVYEVNCLELPRHPYKSHDTVKEAKQHLKSRGVKSPSIRTYEKNN